MMIDRREKNLMGISFLFGLSLPLSWLFLQCLVSINWPELIFSMLITYVPFIVVFIYTLFSVLFIGSTTYPLPKWGIKRFFEIISFWSAFGCGIIIVSGLQYAGVDPDLVRFKFHEQAYLAEVEQLKPDAHGVRQKTWPWGSEGTFLTGSVTTLVYDDASKTAVDPKHSGWTEWDGTVRTKPLKHHFYLTQELE